MWTGKDVTGLIHEQYDVLCGLEQMIEDDVMTNLRWYVYRNRWYRMLSWIIIKFNVDWKECDRKLSLLIWSNNWISTDVRGWCHDLNWHDIWIRTDDKGCSLDQITVLCGLDIMWQEVSWPIWSNIWINTDDTEWWRDLIWGALWLKHLWIYAVMI
jgi:hypothetical protein